MTVMATVEPGEAYTRALGRVLRTRREAMRYSRKALLATFPPDARVSSQAWATWEYGTRAMPVNRLPAVARALGTTPHELLAEVDLVMVTCDVDSTDATVTITVDLAKLATVQASTLGAVARWARAGVHSGRMTARLSMADIGSLAELVSVPAQDLAGVFADAAVITAA